VAFYLDQFANAALERAFCRIIGTVVYNFTLLMKITDFPSYSVTATGRAVSGQRYC
jgi:hypothetical protein